MMSHVGLIPSFKIDTVWYRRRTSKNVVSYVIRYSCKIYNALFTYVRPLQIGLVLAVHAGQRIQQQRIHHGSPEGCIQSVFHLAVTKTHRALNLTIYHKMSPNLSIFMYLNLCYKSETFYLIYNIAVVNMVLSMYKK